MKRKLIFATLTIFILISHSIAQTESLKAEYERLGNELNLFLESKKFDKVIQISNRMIEIDSSEATIFFVRGIAYFSQKKFKQSINDIDKGLEIGLEGDTKINAIRLKGLAYYELEEYASAIQVFDIYLQTKTKDFRGFGLRGFAKFYIKKYEGAIKDFDTSLQLKPEQKGIYRFRGIANFHLENYETALNDLNKEITINPKLMESYLFREKTYRKLGKNELANKDLEKYVKYLLATITKNIDEGRFDFAIKLSNELDEVLPHPETSKLVSTTYSARGVNYLQNNQFKEAVADFSKAIRLDKTSDHAFVGRAKARAGLGEIDKAFIDAQKALALNPKNNSAHTVLSVLYYEKEQFVESEKSANMALLIDKDDFEAVLYRGYSLARLKKFKGALVDLNRYLDKFPKDVDALFTRLVVFGDLEDWNEVRNDATKILAIDKGNLQALSVKASANFALQENFDQIVKDITHIEKTDISQMGSDLYEIRAIVYKKQGKLKLAEADEKKALELEKIESN